MVTFEVAGGKSKAFDLPVERAAQMAHQIQIPLEQDGGSLLMTFSRRTPEPARALLAAKDAAPVPPDNPMSADRVRWEHIQRVFEQCDRNVSETARRLNMHRRTLQRILAKRAPK